ncbi:hypothetical protein KP509_15G068500 [Ceratopteris richardii]|uniref:Uncharacterized protein n=1 Tax=Ceratopteris richardii TaxID=49495 RepID=A0A8T2T8Z5_CERRI|nr:hypothetical protein KP509_15G068500 [Ceratopteris richardii]
MAPSPRYRSSSSLIRRSDQRAVPESLLYLPLTLFLIFSRPSFPALINACGNATRSAVTASNAISTEVPRLSSSYSRIRFLNLVSTSHSSGTAFPSIGGKFRFSAPRPTGGARSPNPTAKSPPDGYTPVVIPAIRSVSAPSPSSLYGPFILCVLANAIIL